MRSLDVLVVGGGTSALVTAALLGRRGLRGLLVDHLELGRPDPAVREDWAFDDRNSPILSRLHESLGLQDELRRWALPMRPGLRIIKDPRRIELEPEDSPSERLAHLLDLEPNRVELELQRLAEAGKTVGRFLGNLRVFPPKSFFERRKVHGAASACPELLAPVDTVLSEPVGRCLQSLLPFLTRLAPKSPPTLGRLARPAWLLLQGPRLPDNGRPLRSVLEERAVRSGFEVCRGGLSAVEPEGRRFRVQVQGHRDPLFFRAVVDASLRLSALEALPNSARERRMEAAVRSVRPEAFLVRFAWLVDRRVLPEPLGACALLLPQVPDGLPIWLTVRNGGERALLEAETPVWLADRNQIKIQVQARLRSLLPFLEEGHPEPQPTTSTPLFAEMDPVTQLGGLSHRAPSIRNVFLAGPTVVPGSLTLEGAYLSATQAAAASAEALGA